MRIRDILSGELLNRRWIATVTTALLRRMCSDLVPSLNDYRGHELIGFYTFAITVAWLAVAMRLMSQRISRAKLSLDDYLVIVALVR